jgi:hypothetical protein
MELDELIEQFASYNNKPTESLKSGLSKVINSDYPFDEKAVKRFTQKVINKYLANADVKTIMPVPLYNKNQLGKLIAKGIEQIDEQLTYLKKEEELRGKYNINDAAMIVNMMKQGEIPVSAGKEVIDKWLYQVARKQQQNNLYDYFNRIRDA